MSKPIDVIVRDAGNTYSCSAAGLRASCTGGARFAAERLAEKLYGAGATVVPQPAQPSDDRSMTRWRLQAPEQAEHQVYVDCGECPRVSTGCLRACERAAKRNDDLVRLGRAAGQ